jgi:5-methylcytosine-specific restriction endonuclease McrA
MIPLPTQADALLSRARRLIHDHRSRAKRDGVCLNYTLDDLRRLLAEHPLCEYCRTPLSFEASLDHRQPIAQGGRHELQNLAVVCLACQERKGLLLEEEYRELLTVAGTWRPRSSSDLLARLRAGGGARYGKKTTPAPPTSAAERVALAKAEYELARARLAEQSPITDKESGK